MTKKNEKRSFVFYDSFLEAMKQLNDAEFRECVLKIRDYALEGIDEVSQSPFVNIINNWGKMIGRVSMKTQDGFNEEEY